MRRPTGFSLVEVLVAITLVAFALLALARLQLVTLGDGARALESLAALDRVSSHAERLRALHGAEPAVRALLATAGAPTDCHGPRLCTPLEFVAGEASAYAAGAALALPGASAAVPRWRVEGALVEALLELQRHGRSLLRLEVAS